MCLIVKFLCAICAFCLCIFAFFWVHFLNFLLSGAACVVDFSDLNINIGDNQYGEGYHIGNKQYSSKNLSCCPIYRFSQHDPLNFWQPERERD